MNRAGKADEAEGSALNETTTTEARATPSVVCPGLPERRRSLAAEGSGITDCAATTTAERPTITLVAMIVLAARKSVLVARKSVRVARPAVLVAAKFVMVVSESVWVARSAVMVARSSVLAAQKFVMRRARGVRLGGRSMVRNAVSTGV